MKTKIRYGIAVAFLYTIATATGFSNSLNSLIDNGKVSLEDYELVARVDVSGASGIHELVNDELNIAQGIVNFDKGKLSQNQGFIFDKITIGYSLGVADTDTSAGAVSYATALTAALRNAEFEILQDGKVVLSLPAASLSNPYTSGSKQEDKWTELERFYALSDEETMTWRLKFPSGVSVPAFTGAGGTQQSLVEVRLGGFRTTKKVTA